MSYTDFLVKRMERTTVRCYEQLAMSVIMSSALTTARINSVFHLSVSQILLHSMMRTMVIRSEVIKAADVTKGATVINKQNQRYSKKWKSYCLFFINEKQLAGDSISEAFICEKALEIYNDLVKKTPGTGAECVTFEFKACRGWFEKIKKRSEIHGVIRHGETVEKFVIKFSDLIKEGGYLPQQVFNEDEAGLFWKRMSNRTCITKDEKALPGHKPMKDRLTLLLCSNASGNFKVKPLLVYHSDNPSAFKRNNVMTSKLSVMWRANTKAWITRQFFIE
eukprot:XP_014776636.1 PREDICTED: tigger transposable element-derived protein 1-like [Octopus bimaculoides]